jgi:predicted dehydrogenase
MRPLRVGLVGYGWITVTHARAFRAAPGVDLVAVAALPPDLGGLGDGGERIFAEAHGIPQSYPDYRIMLERGELDLVCVGLPNAFHARVALDVVRAGKHVVVEKPLCVNLEEGEALARAVAEADVVLGYAEELCFVPKYVRAKELVAEGAIGKVRLIKQTEAHSGPYSPWFFTRDLAGGGILMDMGCHSIEYARWLLGKPKATSVLAHLGRHVHTTSEVEDYCLLVIDFEGGATAVCESGWNRKGGMISRSEIWGEGGVIEADMLKGTALQVHSERGFLGGETGWQHVDWAWDFQNGYPQEMAHFALCARTGRTPDESAADGLVVLELMLAAYHSAGTGRRVALPFRPAGIERPVDLWLHPRPELG